jgi:hypothetical protein
MTAAGIDHARAPVVEVVGCHPDVAEFNLLNVKT